MPLTMREELDAAIERALAAGDGLDQPCARPEGHAVEEWIYDLGGVLPLAIGACGLCDAVVLWQLPRAFNPDYRFLMSPAEVQATRLLEQGLDRRGLMVVSDAARERLRPHGGHLRYLADLQGRSRLAFGRDVIREAAQAIVQRLAEQFEAQTKALLQERAELTAAGWRLQEERSRLSRAGVRRELLRVVAARDAIAQDLKLLRAEVARLREEGRDLRDRIREERAAARREPLPVPEGYVPPPLDPGSILCGTLAPEQVIYGLVDPVDPEQVRYVGRTADPVTRYRGHVTRGEPLVADWVERLAAEDRAPVMVLLERCTSEDAPRREAHWILHYRRRWQANLNTAVPARLVS